MLNGSEKGTKEKQNIVGLYKSIFGRLPLFEDVVSGKIKALSQGVMTQS